MADDSAKLDDPQQNHLTNDNASQNKLTNDCACVGTDINSLVLEQLCQIPIDDEISDDKFMDNAKTKTLHQGESGLERGNGVSESDVSPLDADVLKNHEHNVMESENSESAKENDVDGSEKDGSEKDGSEKDGSRKATSKDENGSNKTLDADQEKPKNSDDNKIQDISDPITETPQNQNDAELTPHDDKDALKSADGEQQDKDIPKIDTNNVQDLNPAAKESTKESPISDDTSAKPDPENTKSKQEMLKLKIELEKHKAAILDEFHCLDNARLSLQESSLLTQNKILQQRRFLIRALEDICKDRFQQVTKQAANGKIEDDMVVLTLENRKADLDNAIGKLSCLLQNTGSFSDYEVLAQARSLHDECKAKRQTATTAHLQFVEGAINFDELSSMVGVLQTVGLSKEDQDFISTKLLDGAVPGLHSRTRVREVSVESSGTQISSGDLSDHLTVATQTDFDGDKGRIGPAEGKFLLSVNVDDIEENIDRCCESTPVDLLGLSWRIQAFKHWRDQLQIRLYYKNLEFIEKNVEYVEYGYTFKLVNHLNDTWSIVKKESHKIGRDAYWDHVIGWSRLSDPKSGYLNNSWFTIEGKLYVSDVKFYTENMKLF